MKIIQSASHPWVHICGFDQPRIKIFKKIFRTFPKVKLALAMTDNCLHSISIVSGIMSNLAMAKVFGRICPVYMQILQYFI